ncbi:hypothetical protein QTO34_014652, partial [Cnephaeus nilssonii]
MGYRISHRWEEGDDEPITSPSGKKPFWIRLELHKDERVLSLKILPDRVASSQLRDANLANTIIGKAAGHMAEDRHGSKDEWRGMNPNPEPRGTESPPAELELGGAVDGPIGKHVECTKGDGSKWIGMIIHQGEAKPSVCFIKFDADFHIYVYD